MELATSTFRCLLSPLFFPDKQTSARRYAQRQGVRAGSLKEPRFRGQLGSGEMPPPFSNGHLAPVDGQHLLRDQHRRNKNHGGGGGTKPRGEAAGTQSSALATAGLPLGSGTGPERCGVWDSGSRCPAPGTRRESATEPAEERRAPNSEARRPAPLRSSERHSGAPPRVRPAPRPAPTLSQPPEQVQLQRRERPPSAPPARAQLCRWPPGALPLVLAEAPGRRAGSPGPPPPPLGARQGPPRPPRARRAAAGRQPHAPGHAEEPPPPASGPVSGTAGGGLPAGRPGTRGAGR